LVSSFLAGRIAQQQKAVGIVKLFFAKSGSNVSGLLKKVNSKQMISEEAMKRLLAILVILGLLVISVAACGGDEEPTPAPTVAPTTAAAPANQAAPAAQVAAAPAGDAEKGKAVFATSCAACHGPAGEGVQGLGKDMTKSEFIAGLSDEELVAFIKVGRPISDPLNTTKIDMPPKGGNPALTDEQLTDIVAFIRSIHVQ
jgi:disulfide bond formation protein DsbB